MDILDKIIRFFKGEEEPDVDMSKSVDEMTPSEYNRYLKRLKSDRAYAFCERLKNILPIAHKEYINDCKERGYYIKDHFYIFKNKYGITFDDIELFHDSFGYGGAEIDGYEVTAFFDCGSGLEVDIID